MPVTLVSYVDGSPDLVFPIAGSQVTIGRDAGNHIQLPDPKVSRQHASLQPQDYDWLLTDLNSSNGSFVNDERVQTRLLAHGDRLNFGPFVLYYLIDLDPGSFVPSHYIDLSTQAGTTTVAS